MLKLALQKLNSLAVIYQLILLALLGGCFAALSKVALAGIPSMTFVFLRFLIVCIVLALAGAVLKLKITKEKIKSFLAVSTFWWLALLIFAFGVQKTTAIASQFILVSTPVLTAIISTIFFKKGLNAVQWLGVIVAAIGVSYIIFNGKTPNLSDKYFLGNLIVLLSQIVFAIYAAFSQSGKYKSINPVEMIFIAAAFGGIVSLPFAIHESITNPWFMHISMRVILGMLGLGIISGVFYGALQVLIKRVGSSVAILNLYLIPFFGIIWASILLQEKVNPATLIGGIIALAGVKIVTSQK